MPEERFPLRDSIPLENPLTVEDFQGMTQEEIAEYQEFMEGEEMVFLDNGQQ